MAGRLYSYKRDPYAEPPSQMFDASCKQESGATAASWPLPDSRYVSTPYQVAGTDTLSMKQLSGDWKSVVLMAESTGLWIL